MPSDPTPDLSGGRPQEQGEDAHQRRRLKGFALHLLVYFLVSGMAVTANMTMMPGKIWFVLPMVGWGAPLALHAAWAMGLLDNLFGNKQAPDRKQKNGT